jgi:hypothetical protein
MVHPTGADSRTRSGVEHADFEGRQRNILPMYAEIE